MKTYWHKRQKGILIFVWFLMLEYELIIKFERLKQNIN